MRAPQALALVLLTAAGAASQKVVAQAVAVIPVGTRIRVETTNGDLVIGRVSSVRGDSIWLQTARTDTIAVYPGANVRQYEQSGGKDRWRGARRGAAITGAISILAVGLVLRDDLTRRDDIIIPSTVFVVPLGVVFTLMGTVVGALSAGERWSPPRSSLNVGPLLGAPGRIQVAYRFAF